MPSPHLQALGELHPQTKKAMAHFTFVERRRTPRRLFGIGQLIEDPAPLHKLHLAHRPHLNFSRAQVLASVTLPEPAQQQVKRLIKRKPTPKVTADGAKVQPPVKPQVKASPEVKLPPTPKQPQDARVEKTVKISKKKIKKPVYRDELKPVLPEPPEFQAKVTRKKLLVDEVELF